MVDTLIKFKIKQDWDSFPTYEFDISRPSYFSGRKNEVDQLSHWITDSTGGSFLVSGARGVGKTAFVYQSIRSTYDFYKFSRYIRAKKDWMFRRSGLLLLIGKIIDFILCTLIDLLWRFKSFRKITVVPINASTINPYRVLLSSKENRLLYESYFAAKPGLSTIDEDLILDNKSELLWQFVLLQQLISSLRFAKVRSLYLRNRLDALYKWSISEGSDSEEKNRLFNIEFVTKLRSFADLLLPFSASFLAWSLIQNQLVFDTLSVALSIFTGILSGIVLTSSFSKSYTQKIQINSKNFDYLYSQLNDILKNANNEVFVFIIDELDKLESSERTPVITEEKLLAYLVDGYKNIITLSSSRFIFISSKNYYLSRSKLLGRTMVDNPKTTYFNWEMFLPPVSYTDLDLYIQNIFEDLKELKYWVEDRPGEFEILISYLYYKTQGMHFSVKRILHDSLTIYTPRQPTILSGLISHDEVHLSFLISDLKRRQARIGKIIRVFEDTSSSIRGVEQSDYTYLRRDIFQQIIGDILSDEGYNTSLFNYASLSVEDLNTVNLSESNRMILTSTYRKKLVSEIKWFLEIFDRYSINVSGNMKSSQLIGEDQKYFEVFKVSFEDIVPRIDDVRDIFAGYSPDEIVFMDMYKSMLRELNRLIRVIHDDYLNTPLKLLNLIYLDPKKEFERMNSLYEKLVNLLDGNGTRKSDIDPGIVSRFTQYIKKSEWDNLSSWDDILPLIVKQYWERSHKMYRKGSVGIGYAEIRMGQKKIVLTTNKKVIPFGKILDLISDFNGLKSSEDWNLLLENIQNYFGITQENILLHDELISNSLLEGVISSWREISTPLDLSIIGDGFIRSLSFNISSASNYWRAGLGLGCEKEVGKIDDGHFSLWHLYKDNDSVLLKFRRVPNSNIVSHEDYMGEVSGVDANTPITLRFTRNMTGILNVYVNNMFVDAFSVPEVDFRKIALLVWGDGQESIVVMSKISISFEPKVKIVRKKKTRLA